MSEATVHLVSKEGDSFSLPLEAAKLSALVATMMDEEDEESREGVQEIPLSEISSKILALVVDFAIHQNTEPMKEIQKPLRTNNMKEVVQEWYAEFISIDMDTLFELISAANYMEIKSLLELACTAIACKVRGKAPNEIREVFNITEDFTAAELDQVREENR